MQVDMKTYNRSTHDLSYIWRNIENIIGSAKDDTFIGSNESNNINGGDGQDWVDYSVINNDNVSGTFGIQVTLKGSTLSTVTVNGSANDYLRNIENIIGSKDNDIIVGDNFSNTLVGGDGDDKLYGGNLVNGVHVDSGNDTVDYSSALESLIIDLDISLAGGVVGTGTYGKSIGSTSTQGQGIDELYGIENILGSVSMADTIYGSMDSNIIRSQGGNDLIVARDYNDGIDYYDGGTGSDTLDYSVLGSSNAIKVNLNVVATTLFSGSTGSNDAWIVTVTSGDNVS